MSKTTMTLLISVLCVACSTTSGVVPSGKDTYLISRSEKGFDKTGSRVKAAVFKEASEYCSKSGKTMEVIKANEKDMVPFRSDAQAEVEFRCQ
ncbi:MAG: hypothetical protein ACREBC_37760 [Pyrinomonadaceae bacterium]